jgi:hypothetical protein
MTCHPCFLAVEADTARRPRARPSVEVPNMTPEEHDGAAMPQGSPLCGVGQVEGPSRPLLCPIRACFSGLCLPRRAATSPHAPRGQPSKRPGTSVERPEIRSSCWVSQVCIASTSGRLRC